jgi:hypothetical protein
LGETSFRGLGIRPTYSLWGPISFIGFSFAGFDRAEDAGITFMDLPAYFGLKVRFQASWPKMSFYRMICLAS